MDTRHTATHEAGHAVAHIRHGIDQAWVTIVPDGATLGAATADDAHWDHKDGEAQALAYCAGFGACVAAGYPIDQAGRGCDDDFEKALAIIEFWNLGELEAWKAQAVALMRRPENVRAVALVAKALIRRGRIDSDFVGVLVDVADGETTEEEFAQYLAFRGLAA